MIIKIINDLNTEVCLVDGIIHSLAVTDSEGKEIGRVVQDDYKI